MTMCPGKDISSFLAWISILSQFTMWPCLPAWISIQNLRALLPRLDINPKYGPTLCSPKKNAPKNKNPGRMEFISVMSRMILHRRFGTYCCTKVKVPVFSILPLTASSVSFGLETKVIEEINAESQALKFLKSVKEEPSYGCLKFVRGFENEMRENEFVCGRKFRFFAFCRSQLHLTALT